MDTARQRALCRWLPLQSNPPLLFFIGTCKENLHNFLCRHTPHNRWGRDCTAFSFFALDVYLDFCITGIFLLLNVILRYPSLYWDKLQRNLNQRSFSSYHACILRFKILKWIKSFEMPFYDCTFDTTITPPVKSEEGNKYSWCGCSKGKLETVHANKVRLASIPQYSTFCSLVSFFVHLFETHLLQIWDRFFWVS